MRRGQQGGNKTGPTMRRLQGEVNKEERTRKGRQHGKGNKEEKMKRRRQREGENNEEETARRRQQGGENKVITGLSRSLSEAPSVLIRPLSPIFSLNQSMFLPVTSRSARLFSPASSFNRPEESGLEAINRRQRYLFVKTLR
ncbi:hypothetical protein PAMP_013639 [Pampus punctatissimus]